MFNNNKVKALWLKSKNICIHPGEKDVINLALDTSESLVILILVRQKQPGNKNTIVNFLFNSYDIAWGSDALKFSSSATSLCITNFPSHVVIIIFCLTDTVF